MIQVLVERRAPLLLFVILFALLVLLSSQARSDSGGSLLESFLFRLAGPVARSAHAVGTGTTGWVGDYVDLRLAHVENLRLKEELSGLQVERQRWESERHEYQRLLTLLQFKERMAVPSVAARVITRGHGLGAFTLVIDRGSRDGLAPGQPVIVPDGVAGRVVEVAPSTAKVRLALDPNSSIAVLTERSRAQGMVVGRGQPRLRMDYVSDLEDVQPGDRVVTSGLDRIFTPGLVIGTVLRAERGEGLVQSIEVEAAVDFDRLEEVLVLTPPAAGGS